MTTIQVIATSHQPEVAILLIDSSLKVTALLLIAAIAARLLASASAALRHQVWSLGMVSILLLPAATLAMPHLRIPLVSFLVEWADQVSVAGVVAQTHSFLITDIWQTRQPIDDRVVTANPTSVDTEILTASTGSDTKTANPRKLMGNMPFTRNRSQVINSTNWRDVLRLIYGVWLAGFLLVLIPILAGFAVNQRLLRRSQRLVDHEMRQLVEEMSARLKLKCQVWIYELPESVVPMTWGVFCPTILIPRDWRNWPTVRQRCVLLHELAHIKRCDVVFQVIGRVSTAVYWFHPLTWYALRQMRIEREYACDNNVLAAGELPSNYARELVLTARELRSVPLAVAASMANSARLDYRVEGILDPARSRRPITSKQAIISKTIFAALILSLASTSRIKTTAIADEQELIGRSTDTKTPETQASETELKGPRRIEKQAPSRFLNRPKKQDPGHVQNIPKVDQLDGNVLGGTPADNLDEARKWLDEILEGEILEIDRICGLSTKQIQKLHLAGHGDVKRLFERLEACRRSFETDPSPQELPDPGGWWNNPRILEIFDLRNSFRSGPFGEDSIFAKTHSVVLTDEQRQMLEQHRQMLGRSENPITTQNAAKLENVSRIRGGAFRAKWSSKSGELGTLEFGKSLQIRSPDGARILRTIGEGEELVSFDFHPHVDVIAIGNKQSSAFLLNQNNNQKFEIHTDGLQPSVVFSPDGKLLATGGYRKKIELWSVETGELNKVIELVSVGGQDPPEGGLTPAFSPDGTIVAVGNRNARTQLFEVASGKFLRELPYMMSHELKFDPTGKMLVVAYVDGTVATWDVASGKVLAKAKTSTVDLYTVDWSPDGSVIATAGMAGSVELWDAETLTRLRGFACPEWIHSGRFNPAGTRLIFTEGSSFASKRHSIQVWAVP